MKDNNSDSNFLVKFEDTIADIQNRIEELTSINKSENINEIKFMKHLKNNFTQMSNCQDQISRAIPFVQNEISENWKQRFDKTFELERKENELIELRKNINSVQNEERQQQLDKEKLSKQLKNEETNLKRNQKKFNKKSNQIAEAQKQIILNLKENPNDNFVGKVFKIQTEFAAKRMTNMILNKSQEKNNLLDKIRQSQDNINQTGDDIEYHQNQLFKLQKENIKLQRQLQSMIDNLQANTLEIKKTAEEIDKGQITLKQLTLAMVEIANEKSREHAFYKKHCVSPLNNLDYELLLQESSLNFNIDEDLSHIINPKDNPIDNTSSNV